MRFEYSDDYAIKFGNFTEIHFQQKEFANDLIQSWQSLVESLDEPYDDILDEFLFDISSLRGTIELCISEKSLDAFNDHQIFKQQIATLDNTFVVFTQEHPEWKHLTNFKWWEKRIPKKVTPNFFYENESDYFEKSGVQFEIIN